MAKSFKIGQESTVTILQFNNLYKKYSFFCESIDKQL